MGKRSLLNSKEKKSFLVIGGHSPIALTVANRLSREGRVFLVTRKADEEIRNFVFKEVVLIESDIESLANQSIESIPILKEVNSIIFAHRYRGNPEDIEEAFRCEVLYPHALIRNLTSIKTKVSLKNVLFFTSPGASRILSDQAIGYHLTKAAVSQMIKYLAVSLAQHGINVVGISPSSFVAKKRSEEFYRKNSRLKTRISRSIPSGEFVTCEEISELVCAITLTQGLSLSGNILNIDHGLGLIEASTLIRV